MGHRAGAHNLWAIEQGAHNLWAIEEGDNEAKAAQGPQLQKSKGHMGVHEHRGASVQGIGLRAHYRTNMQTYRRLTGRKRM